MKVFVFTNKRYIRHQHTVRVIVVNSVLFIFFLPFPVRWQRPRVKFAALPPSPTRWSPSRETRLTTNCLPRVGGPHHYAKHLWKDGTICLEGGFGGTSNTTTPLDQRPKCQLPLQPQRQPGGDSLRFWYQDTKLLNFLDMLGGGCYCQVKATVPAIGRKNSNSHRS